MRWHAIARVDCFANLADAWDDAKRRQNLAKHGIDLTLRLDQDLLDHFKAGGPGWQTRINDALRGAAKKTAAGR